LRLRRVIKCKKELGLKLEGLEIYRLAMKIGEAKLRAAGTNNALKGLITAKPNDMPKA